MEKLSMKGVAIGVLVLVSVCIFFPSVGSVIGWVLGTAISLVSLWLAGVAVQYLAKTWFNREVNIIVGLVIGLFVNGLAIFAAVLTFLFKDTRTLKDVIEKAKA